MASSRLLVGACVVFVLGLAFGFFLGQWYFSVPYGSGPPGSIRFALADENGFEQDRLTFGVNSGSISVSLIGRPLFASRLGGGFPVRTDLVLPYVKIELESLDHTKLMVAPDDVVLSDSEGHYFGVQPFGEISSEGLCFAVDQGEFNRRVQYNTTPYDWQRIRGESGADEYVLSLRMRFMYSGTTHTIEVPRIESRRFVPP